MPCGQPAAVSLGQQGGARQALQEQAGGRGAELQLKHPLWQLSPTSGPGTALHAPKPAVILTHSGLTQR